jgi:hypothetical protein
MRTCRIALILAAALLGGASAAPAQVTSTTATPDFSGLWLIQDPGSRSWADFYDNVPRPQIRPEIVKNNEAQVASERAGNVVNRMPRRAGCPIGNLPMMMASSPPLNIVTANGEVLVASESGRARFIYTDGRTHPDTHAAEYVPTGFGHSVGSWDGRALVVDTVGFPPTVCDSRKPVMVTPGGGRAKETTHLVERYQLLDDNTLSVTFTWSDPTVFTAPHTYSYTYKRIPEGTPIENNETGGDPGRLFITDQVEK